MQVSIESILQAHGKLGDFSAAFILDREFYVKFEQPHYMPLVIEKVGPDRVAVGHFFVVNGDVQYDPEIVFHVPTWTPVEITQVPVYIAGRVRGGYRAKFITRDGKTYVDRRFDRDVAELVRIWAKNLRHQGWDEAPCTAQTEAEPEPDKADLDLLVEHQEYEVAVGARDKVAAWLS